MKTISEQKRERLINEFTKRHSKILDKKTIETLVDAKIKRDEIILNQKFRKDDDKLEHLTKYDGIQIR